MDQASMTLREAVEAGIEAAVRLLAEPGPRGAREALTPARKSLVDARGRWEYRMRVAMAGRPSAGKSTLINALLGQRLAETHAQEMTKVVTWLAHGPAPRLTVHDKDGQAWPVDPPTLDKLAELTTHKFARGSFSDTASFVRYEHPNDWLEIFDIIDTPGNDSELGTDSDMTVRHLGPHEDTADALIIVFPKAGARTEDIWLAEHFQNRAEGGPSAVNPLTTVGALTFIEHDYWKDNGRKPGLIENGELREIRTARAQAGALMAEPSLRGVLYDLRPVASKVAEAAGLLDDEDFAALAELVAAGQGRPPLSPADLVRLTVTSQRWNRDAPLPAERSARLMRMLTGYGIVLCGELICSGVDSRQELARQLRDLSGLTAFQSLISQHFVERADLIKLVRLMARTRTLVAASKPLLGYRQQHILEQAALHILRLGLERAEFDEQRVLRSKRDGLLELSDHEIDEMMRVFGETTGAKLVAERLGLPGGSPRELAALAAQRSEHWSRQADGGPYDGETRAACLVISRSYDHLGAAISR
jgi:transposase